MKKQKLRPNHQEIIAMSLVDLNFILKSEYLTSVIILNNNRRIFLGILYIIFIAYDFIFLIFKKFFTSKQFNVHTYLGLAFLISVLN